MTAFLVRLRTTASTAARSDPDQWAAAASWLSGLAGALLVLCWSGPYYLPFPELAWMSAAAGIIGAVTGPHLLRILRNRHPSAPALVTVAPILLFTVAVLTAAGATVVDRISADYQADLDAYKGRCLAHGRYSSHADTTVRVSPATVEVAPRRGPSLRFARTGQWISADRGMLGGEAVVPADDITLDLLAAQGCR